MKYLVLAFLFLSACSYHVSDGERTGIITRVTKAGFFCKTNEITMSVGYTKDGVGTVSKDEFHFTISDDSVLKKAKSFQDKNIPVKIDYHKELFCLCDSVDCFFGDDVNPVY